MIEFAIFVIGLVLGVIAGPFLIGSVIVGLFAASTAMAKIRGEI